MTFERFTGGFCQTNGYLISIGSGHLLVDAPEGVAAWLARLGVKPDALLLTHQHFDHVDDAAAVQRDFACPVYAWSPASRSLWMDDLFSSYAGMNIMVPPFTVDHLLEGQTALTVGGAEFSLLHVPGHSTDSVCFLHTPSGNCFCGDTLFLQGIGRTDLPGGSYELLVSGILTKLLTLPSTTRLHPGHGESTSVAGEMNNPWLAE